MKSTAVQLAKTHIKDNRKFITGNVAEYLIQELDSNELNFFHYLTDNEIEEMNGKAEKWHSLGEEVYAMIRNNFDYDISEFEY